MTDLLQEKQPQGSPDAKLLNEDHIISLDKEEGSPKKFHGHENSSFMSEFKDWDASIEQSPKYNHRDSNNDPESQTFNGKTKLLFN